MFLDRSSLTVLTMNAITWTKKIKINDPWSLRLSRADTMH